MARPLVLDFLSRMVVVFDSWGMNGSRVLCLKMLSLESSPYLLTNLVRSRNLDFGVIMFGNRRFRCEEDCLVGKFNNGWIF